MEYYVNAVNQFIEPSCFSARSSLETIDLSNVDFVNNSMNNSFRELRNLTDVVNMPSNVTTMDCTFQNCTNLVNVSELPANVTYLGGAFAECRNLPHAPNIPNGVTSLLWTFANCNNLLDTPEIPNSVVDMTGTFSYCYLIENAPAIPNSVENMDRTFMNCYNLVNAPEIPDSVTNLFATFYNCSSLVNAPVINENALITSLRSTFSGCTSLVNVPVINTDAPVVNMYYTFYNCYNISSFPNIPNTVTDLSWAFRACYAPTTSPNIPNSVTNMCGTFCVADHLQTVGEIGTGVIDMNRAFGWCPNIVGDVVIHSPNVTNATSCFTSSNSAKHKDVYIPFTYQNGVNTATYNAFRDAGYTTTGTSQGVYLRDLAYYNTSQTINVTTNPAEATVTFNSSDPNAVISGNSITAKSYSSLTITASYTGYNNKVEIIDPFGPWTNDVSLTLTPEGQFSPGPYTADSGLTENNYVYSNFYGTTGIQVPSTYASIGNEIVTKFRITKEWNSETNNDKFVFGQDSLDIYINNGIIKFWSRTYGAQTILDPVMNTWYWIKAKLVNSTTLTISISTDGETWNTIGTYDHWDTMSGKTITMGTKNASDSSAPFPGEIDMSGFRVYDSNGNSIWGTE